MPSLSCSSPREFTFEAATRCSRSARAPGRVYTLSVRRSECRGGAECRAERLSVSVASFSATASTVSPRFKSLDQNHCCPAHEIATAHCAKNKKSKQRHRTVLGMKQYLFDRLLVCFLQYPPADRTVSVRCAIWAANSRSSPGTIQLPPNSLSLYERLYRVHAGCTALVVSNGDAMPRPEKVN